MMLLGPVRKRPEEALRGQGFGFFFLPSPGFCWVSENIFPILGICKLRLKISELGSKPTTPLSFEF